MPFRHELTHSYFGNGVTYAASRPFGGRHSSLDRQKDATAFWLNEGWTTYFERVLQYMLHGAAARDFSYIIGAKALVDSLRAYESRPKYQRLVIDFEYGEVVFFEL